MIEDIKIGDTVWFREALLRSHKPQKAIVRGLSKNGKYIQQEEVFERLWKYKMNNHYSDKENALTLVYFNKGE